MQNYSIYFRSSTCAKPVEKTVSHAVHTRTRATLQWQHTTHSVPHITCTKKRVSSSRGAFGPLAILESSP